MAAPGRFLRRGRLAPRRRLGALPLLLARQSRARRSRHACVHLRPAARVRRRPHRGDRQHDAEVPPGRQALARRRVLLLARALDDRALPRHRARARRLDRQLAHPRLPGLRRLHRRERVRNVPLDHRHPQPDRAHRHRAHLPAHEAGLVQRGGARGAAARSRHDEPLPGPLRAQDQGELADVPARDALRPRLRHRNGGRPARDRGRRRHAPRTRARRPLAADPVRRRDEPDGHGRRRIHVAGVRLGVLEPGAEGLLQHDRHDASPCLSHS